VGQDADVRDLYAERFDPCLKAEEIPGPGEPKPGADVVAEREKLAAADVFAFVYPLWFNAPPAMLKGYVDRVFGMGFGYGPGMEPRLEGKKMISFSSSGAPSQWVRETGAWRALRNIFDEHLAQVCGLEVIDHVHFGEISPGITNEAVARCTLKLQEAFRMHFARS
jgi:NAD(P)H dehydrogenase (quinone)